MTDKEIVEKQRQDRQKWLDKADKYKKELIAKGEVPTYEEFEKAVILEAYTYLLNAFPKDKVDNYLRSVEAKRHIRSEWLSNCEDYENGKITLRIFCMGGVEAVGNCLHLMYE